MIVSISISDRRPYNLQLDLAHPHVRKFWINHTYKVRQLVLSMPDLEKLYIFASTISELIVASNKSVTLESTRYEGSSCGGPKKVFKRGKPVTLIIDFKENMLKVVHGEDTMWMEQND